MKNIRMMAFSMLVSFPAYGFCVDNNEVKKDEVKVLTCPAALALKGVLEQHPDGAAHILTSLENSKKIISGLEVYQQKMNELGVSISQQNKLFEKATEKFKGIIINPIKQFFILVYDYKSLLKPLLEESLSDGRVAGFQQSILYKFLGAPRDLAPTFFEDNVQTKDELIAACKQFIVLFGDMEVSMPVAFKAGRKFLEELNKQEEGSAKGEAVGKEVV